MHKSFVAYRHTSILKYQMDIPQLREPQYKYFFPIIFWEEIYLWFEVSEIIFVKYEGKAKISK